jgi:hypothetical protein
MSWLCYRLRLYAKSLTNENMITTIMANSTIVKLTIVKPD